MSGIRSKRKQRRASNLKHKRLGAVLARREREEYVLHVSVTGNIHMPFWDEKHYEAAIKYIETGDESLKEEFPSIFRR